MPRLGENMPASGLPEGAISIAVASLLLKYALRMATLGRNLKRKCWQRHGAAISRGRAVTGAYVVHNPLHTVYISF